MLPFFALTLPVLVLLCGLIMDVGMMENRSLAMQTAADAAALGAELQKERGSTDWVQMGTSVAALNGFTNGANGATVTITQAPASGAFAGSFDAVEVRITSVASTIFMHYLNAATVSTRSVALIPPCVFLTGSPSTTGANALSATASVLNLGCPAYSNGPGVADSASSLSATAWNLTPNSGPISGGASVSPVPSLNARTLPDPLAALSQPTVSSCTSNSFSQTGGSARLSPGVFCKGLTLSNTSVTLAPGLYVVTGGAHWSNANVQGTGVTLFFTQGGGAPFGQFVVDAQSRITLSAPVDGSGGAIPGVLLFADRQWVATGSFDFQLSNATVQADGIWYTSSSGVSLVNSTLGPNQYLALDVPAISLSSSRLRTSGDFSSVTTGSPFRPLGGTVE